MSAQSRKTVVLIYLLGSAMIFTSCGFRNEKGAGTTSASGNLATLMSSSGSVPGYNTLKAQIFDSQCISCHGNSGGVNLETYASAVNAASLIRSAVIDQQVMPPSGPLGSLQQQAIAAWLDNGMPENDIAPNTSTDPTTPAPSPQPTSDPAPTATPTPSGSPTSGTISFAQVNNQIFSAQCLQCHSGSRASAGVDLSSYANVVKNISLIQSAALDNQNMPPSGPLSTADQTLLQTWIKEGTPQ